MQHTLFIADLHLDVKHQHSVKLFSDFIHQQAIKADALYILGDFFELWVGDDDDRPFNESIKNLLKHLTTKNIPVYFLHGNRDFLIGKKFAKDTGCKILPENNLIEVYGEQALVLHGDVLCAQDIRHLKFRKLTLNKIIQFIFLRLPLKIRQKIGYKLRKTSGKYHQTSSDTFGVCTKTVTEMLVTHNVARMIHGHIHQPLMTTFLNKGKYYERIVLGAWEEKGCALKWYQNGTREMIFFD